MPNLDLALLLLATCVHGQGGSTSTTQATQQQNGLTLQNVLSSNADTTVYASAAVPYAPGGNYTVFAPTNTALQAVSAEAYQLRPPGIRRTTAGQPTNRRVRSRDTGYSPLQALMSTDRQTGNVDLATEAAVLVTLLTDPAYANLGPGQGARIISMPGTPLGSTTISIISGLGNSSTVSLENIAFSDGVVNIANQ